MKFTEAHLEFAIIELLQAQGYPYTPGGEIVRSEEEVLILEDLRNFLRTAYAANGILDEEVDQVINELKRLPASDLYSTNKLILEWVRDGKVWKRHNAKAKDFLLNLIDFEHAENNIYSFVNQLEITGTHKRIPDGVLYINGLPLAVFEFKNAIREEATIHEAYKQVTVRYRRDIPDLLKYNALLESINEQTIE